MRRAQTVKHRQSHSLAVADELGMAREAQSIENVLRQDLAASRRENERLQSQVDSLHTVLKSRPAAEEYEELRREYNSLELLLHGTQKENERAMAELERIKNRERQMAQKLKEYAGDDWEDTLNIPGTSSAVPSSRLFGTVKSRIGASDTTQSGEQTQSMSTDATLEHMERIRAMLTGMAERLQTGEEKMRQALARAEEEKERLDEILIDASA